MNSITVTFIVVWALFWSYCLVSAFSMSQGRVPWSRELLIRVVIAASW